MESQYYEVIKRLYEEDKTFYTIFGSNVSEAKIVGLSGDYAIISAKINEQNVRIHCHFSQVEVIGSL
jgi:hypothetical protein